MHHRSVNTPTGLEAPGACKRCMRHERVQLHALRTHGIKNMSPPLQHATTGLRVHLCLGDVWGVRPASVSTVATACAGAGVWLAARQCWGTIRLLLVLIYTDYTRHSSVCCQVIQWTSPGCAGWLLSASVAGSRSCRAPPSRCCPPPRQSPACSSDRLQRSSR
jgi:hypothetical protein